MKRRTFSLYLFIFGVFLAFIPIIFIRIKDSQSLSTPESLKIIDTDSVELSGTYYHGSNPYGVILLEGFGSDQITMTTLASEFAANSWHVLTFDFSGHGRSSGTLAFDNASTDRLAGQTLVEFLEFKNIANLNTNQIFLVGHSLGARVALQTASLESNQLAGLILLGTQINLSTNVQSEFFTGTSDIDLEWIQSLNQINPPEPILMISGDWDDILTPESAELLFNKLTDGNYEHQNGTFQSQNSEYPIRDQTILPFLFHNYEPFSSRVIRVINAWLQNKFDVEMVDSSMPIIRTISWVLSLVGIFTVLLVLGSWYSKEDTIKSKTLAIKINNLKRFLWGKIILWLGALPFAAILGGIFFFIPIGKPVLNLIYVCFIGGYGILLFLLYRVGKVPGIEGKLGQTTRFPKSNCMGFSNFGRNRNKFFLAFGITVIILLLTAAYARTGWFYVFPANLRLIWLFIFTPFTSLGFWIGIKEAQILPKQRWPQIAHMLIGLFPFFVYTILMAAIGSLSGMIGGFQGLIILWLVISYGNLIQSLTELPWLAATCMTTLLYWLILPQGVLF